MQESNDNKITHNVLLSVVLRDALKVYNRLNVHRNSVQVKSILVQIHVKRNFS